jgi:branched-chain amino acid transport system permease protein
MRSPLSRRIPENGSKTKNHDPMIANLLGVLFDGAAYGSLLFIISIGLSVTMGLMNFVNLAHGAFAMVGGTPACADDARRRAVPRDAARRVHRRGRRRHRARAHALPAPLQGAHLDQVMFSIGIVFMSVAAASYFFGTSQQPVRLPDSCAAR